MSDPKFCKDQLVSLDGDEAIVNSYHFSKMYDEYIYEIEFVDGTIESAKESDLTNRGF